MQELKKLAHDLMYIMLKLPQNQSLAFLPGQYIDIVMQDDKKRSFSIANMPNDKSEIELHIRHIEGGLFTGEVFSSMKVNDILRMEGPFGAFFYREEANRPMIFMAGGTGFAPVKSIMEYIISTKVSLPIYIYWGARTEQDLYLKELAENWAQQYDNVHFIPVLSDPNIKEQDWQGKSHVLPPAGPPVRDPLRSDRPCRKPAPASRRAQRPPVRGTPGWCLRA